MSGVNNEGFIYIEDLDAHAADFVLYNTCGIRAQVRITAEYAQAMVGKVVLTQVTESKTWNLRGERLPEGVTV